MRIIRSISALHADAPQGNQPLGTASITPRLIAAHPDPAVRQFLEVVGGVTILPTPPCHEIVVTFESPDEDALTTPNGAPATFLTGHPRFYLIRTDTRDRIVGDIYAIGVAPIKDWFPAGKSVEEYLPTGIDLAEAIRAFVVSSIRDGTEKYATRVEEMHQAVLHGAAMLGALRCFAPGAMKEESGGASPSAQEPPRLVPTPPGCRE